MKNFFLRLAAVAMLAISATACNDNQPEVIADPDTEYTDGNNTQPTEDEIKVRFNGKAFIYAEEGTLMNFIKKRMSNIATSIDDEQISVIFITENAAGQIMTDEQMYEKISNLWWTNRIIAFIHPKANSLQLISRLRRPAYEYTAPEQFGDKVLEGFDDVSIWLMKSNGDNLTVPCPDREQIATYTNTSLNEDGEATDAKNGSLNLTAAPSDFVWGRAAESVTKWLNKHAEAMRSTHPAIATRSDGEEYAIETEYNFDNQLTISYEQAIEDAPDQHDQGIPSPVVINVTHTMWISASYNTTQNSDVYDVKYEYHFPTDEIFISNYTYDKDAAYKWKFSGFCYVGPDIEFSLMNGKNYLTEIATHGPVPILEAGTFTTTHDPGSISLGGSLMTSSSISGGTSGVGVSKTWGKTFSVSGTLPRDYSTSAHDVMPLSFHKNRSDDSNIPAARWHYYRSSYELYDYHGGRNADRLEYNPADVLKNPYDNKAAVTFELKDSQKQAANDLFLSVDISQNLHAEAAGPWDWSYLDYTITDISNKRLLLPIVNRYFEKFTPDYYYTSVANAGTSDHWGNLKATLMGNVHYQALCDETLVVGSRVTTATYDGKECTGTEAAASEVWDEAIKTLINQNNGSKEVEGEWVIGLADADGNYLNFGLRISGKTWERVNDITKYKQ